ncbi:hypothetical protein GT347_01115 [Xylophilus rhododendri]|uniref:Uncharacterized protein n=1 Tax=Xylophilus rhododendri TaxID=2697032 RepID=A0A857J0U2_9BURK|nr:hypothetical protein [Xylophilus rhododendri]QHI96712.1 hypothetical protein GT347_01115 [Xylophilus rhododendri]
MSSPGWRNTQPPSHPVWRRMRLRQDFEDSQVASRLEEADAPDPDVAPSRLPQASPRGLQQPRLPASRQALPSPQALPPHLSMQQPRRRHHQRARAMYIDPFPAPLPPVARRGGVPAWPKPPEKKPGVGRWVLIALSAVLACAALWLATRYLVDIVWKLSAG